MTLAILFDSVGVGEWFILLAVVLIVVGPKNLPSTIRKFGNYYAKFRRAAETFKRQLMDMDTELNNAINAAEKEVESAVSIPEEPLPDATNPQEAYERDFDSADYHGDYTDEDYYGAGGYPGGDREEENQETQETVTAGADVNDGDKTAAES